MSRQLHLKLLSSVIDLLISTGVPAQQIRRSAAADLAKAERRQRPRKFGQKKSTQKNEDLAAQLLRLWHRDHRYLRPSDSGPRSLPLTSGKDNLASLINQLDPKADAEKLLNSMLSVGLIRKTTANRYKPTASATLIPRIHPWSLEHTVRSVDRLVSTVCRNASANAAIPSLLERYSYVPDLDPRRAADFADFSRLQGQLYLDTLDDWLERHRVGKSRSNTGIAAGVHVIAYIEDLATQDALADSEVRSSSRSSVVSSRKKAAKALSTPA